MSSPTRLHPHPQNGRLHRTITTLRHEKEGLDEEIREAEAEGAGDSATQTGQLDDLTYEVEQAEEVIKEAQAEQARLNEMKRAVSLMAGWGRGREAWTVRCESVAYLCVPLVIQQLEEELKPLQDKEANEAKRNKEMDKVSPWVRRHAVDVTHDDDFPFLLPLSPGDAAD